MSEIEKIADAAEAVKGIVQAVPIYQDTLQPAAKEIGTALQTVAKTIHIVLAPISALVWGYEQIKDFVSCKVAKKLENVPIENIITPKPNIAGPALEALKYCGHEETLRDMYANLLASSMNKTTAEGAHPAFVEIIKQLTPDEAKLIKYFSNSKPFPIINVRWEFKVQTELEKGGSELLTNFCLFAIEAGCEFPHLVPGYLDNLNRLGLTEIPQFMIYTTIGVYDQLEKYPEILAIKKAFDDDKKREIKINRKILQLTELGKQFCRVCVS